MSNHQIPTCPPHKASAGGLLKDFDFLEFRSLRLWSLFGYWCLGFGAFAKYKKV